MGIRYESVLIYNLELIPSKDYKRTYSSYIKEPFVITRLLTTKELMSFDVGLLMAVMLLCSVAK